MMLCVGCCLILTVGIFVLKRTKYWGQIRSPCKVLWIFSLLAVMAGIAATLEAGFFEQGQVVRKEPGEGELETEARIYVPEWETEYEMNLIIPERTYDEMEEEKLIAAAKKEIDETFCGTNDSVEAILENPVVKQSYQQGAVTADWEFSNPEVIEEDGEIKQEALEGDILEEASVQLRCGDRQELYGFCFRIRPKEKTKEQRLLSDIRQQIDEQKLTEGQVKLPDYADGKKIEWKDETSTQPFEVLFLGCLAAVTVAYVEKEQKEKKVRARERRLLLEYPEFVSKLSLLLGSGMTISGALRKMNRTYQEQKMEKQESPVYEELHCMICEIDNGMSELRAYQKFADRCSLQPYRKLVSLLISGQKMGNRKLTEALNEEADRVFLERKNAARKLGEEAGTKLLLPMMIMMIIVMGIVMVPAFLSISQM